MTADNLTLLQDLLALARSHGADAADAVMAQSESVSVSRRLGRQEALSRAEESEIGLRVMVGRKQAVVSSSDHAPAALAAMAERAVQMARHVPDDPWCGLAAPEELATSFPALDLYDAAAPSAERLNDMADACEAAALDVAGVTNSDGAEASFGHETVYFAASNGFAQSYRSSGFSVSVSVLAGEGTGMETDYDYDSAIHLADLEAPEKIGRRAGDRAVRALGARKEKTGSFPVVFDRRVSGGLLSLLAGAISGTSVARGTTLLKDKLGAQIFPRGFHVIDDPFLPRGQRSRPFDGEGLPPQRRRIIDDGVLTGWLLDLSTARQLGLASTGNASRGTASAPSPRPANFYLENGSVSLDDLIADIDEGFYVTQMMGSSGNPVLTGDYSRGARGFWIRKGKIDYPVSEMTIAGHLPDMWRGMTAANDLELKTGIDAPTLRLAAMTVAGA